MLKKNNVLSISIIFLLAIFLNCSTSSTGPNSDRIISGSVQLQGASDFSGAKVMLFEIVPVDSNLSNLAVQYPAQGKRIDEGIEFLWWEKTPARQTITGEDGSWSIENILLTDFHLVVEMPGYGWRVKYNAGFGTHNFNLSEAILLNSTYLQPRNIPEDSFVEIAGNAIFADNAPLTIDAGTIVQFQSNSRLQISGQITVNGLPGREVQFLATQDLNNAILHLERANNSLIDNADFLNLEDGILVTSSDSVVFSNLRLKSGVEAINLFDCNAIEIHKSIFYEHTAGIISRSSNRNRFTSNIFYNLSGDGLGSLNENSSLVQNNIFERCNNYGLNINFGGSPGSLIDYFHFDVINNDFVRNVNHLRVGRKGNCVVNGNNFLSVTNFVVWSEDLNQNDTLNFQANYWLSTNNNEIAQKIFDKVDTPTFTRPVIDFSNFAFEYINW